MPGTSLIEASKIVISNLLSLSPTSRRLRGKTSPATTDRGYKLRSLGPATLGSGALDSHLVQMASMVSSSRSAGPLLKWIFMLSLMVSTRGRLICRAKTTLLLP
jgi:hypothetical protein